MSGNGFVTAVLSSSDVRVQKSPKQPFGSSRIGGFGSPARRNRPRRRRPVWGPGSGDGFFPAGGLSELRAYTAGPGSMDPAAWMLTSQMQSDQYGWAFAPNGNPITPGNAYGPALAGGTNAIPSRRFGPAYLEMDAFSTWADPPGNIFQKGVGMRSAEAARELRAQLIRRGFRGVHGARSVSRGTGVSYKPGQNSIDAYGLAQSIADTANLSMVELKEPDGSTSMYFTDMPDALHDQVAERVGGFGAGEDSGPSTGAILAVGALGAAIGGMLGGSWIGAAIGGVVGSALGSAVRERRLLKSSHSWHVK